MFYRPDKRVGAILENFPRERTWLLPALEAVQEEEGWLSLPSLEAVAAYLRVPKSEVYGVTTHYPELRLTRPGARIVRVCTGVSCRVLGGVELLRRLEDRLGIRVRETSSDGRVTLEEADCFFLCSMAPLVEVDRRCHGRVGPADLDRLFDPVPARRAPESPPLLSKPVCGSPLAALEQLRVQSRTDTPRRQSAPPDVGA